MKPYFIGLGLLFLGFFFGFLFGVFLAAVGRADEVKERLYYHHMLYGDPNALPPQGVLKIKKHRK
jgi:hypothetical protein